MNPIYQLLNPLSLELPSEFHKGEDDCSCNVNCKDRGEDDHGGCRQIERKNVNKRRNRGCELLLDKSFTKNPLLDSCGITDVSESEIR
jgi:hypothetical protein